MSYLRSLSLSISTLKIIYRKQNIKVIIWDFQSDELCKAIIWYFQSDELLE